MAEANNDKPGVRWAWPWLSERDYEQGEYMCHCTGCGFAFRGHKRQVTCKLCAQPHGAASA